METIEQIALRVWLSCNGETNHSNKDKIKNFAKRLLAEVSKGEPMGWISKKYLLALQEGEEGYAKVYGNETMDSCIPLYLHTPIPDDKVLVEKEFLAQLRPAVKRYEQQAQQSLLACQKGGYPAHYEPVLKQEAEHQAALFDQLEAILATAQEEGK